MPLMANGFHSLGTKQILKNTDQQQIVGVCRQCCNTAALILYDHHTGMQNIFHDFNDVQYLHDIICYMGSKRESNDEAKLQAIALDISMANDNEISMRKVLSV